MITNPHSYNAYTLLHQGVLALSRAEQAGFRVDLDYIQKRKTYLTKKIDRLERQLKETKFYKHWEHVSRGKVNIHSDQQLANFLYKFKGLKSPKDTPSGQGSVDEESLKQLEIPELDMLLEVRKLKRIRDTYLEGFEREAVNGYIHPFFDLNLVRTYRSGSSRPNMQNVPIRDKEAMQITRQALYPRPGHQLLEVDFSGLEVRISACYTKDKNMLEYINNPASDMHRDMAKQIFMLDEFDSSQPSHKTLRGAAKNGFVFPEFYGDYYGNCAYNMACGWGNLPKGKWKAGQGIELPDGTLSDHLISKGIKSLMQFEDHLQEIEKDFWNNRFPGYRDWREIWWETYQKHGYFVMLTGFMCSGVMGFKELINYPISGAAFHCNLWSFIELDKVMRQEKWDTRLIGEIHDSIIMDVNPDELGYVAKIVKKITTVDLPKAWDWIIVPLEVEMELSPVDSSWAEKKKFDL